MRRDNRGLTLMELVIAMTIATIIMAAAITFISNALRSYRVASDTIDLQMEAHVAMEQIGVWVMEGNYVVTEDDGTAKGLVPRSGAGDKKAMTVYYRPRPIDVSRLPVGTTVNEDGRVVASASAGAGSTPYKRVIWLDDGGLYMVEETFTDDSADAPEADFASYELPADAAARKNCISPYVVDMDCVWNNDRETYVVTLQMKAGTQEHTLKDELTMRNQYVAPTAATPSPTAGP